MTRRKTKEDLETLAVTNQEYWRTAAVKIFTKLQSQRRKERICIVQVNKTRRLRLQIKLFTFYVTKTIVFILKLLHFQTYHLKTFKFGLVFFFYGFALSETTFSTCGPILQYKYRIYIITIVIKIVIVVGLYSDKKYYTVWSL